MSETSNMQENEDLSQFDLSLKKKKKKKVVKEEKGDEKGDEKDDEKGNEKEDYDYVFLLERIYGNLRSKHPTLSVHKKLVIPPPQVLSLSSKKTMLSNFNEIVSIINRQTEHVQSFFISELSTNCNIDSMSRMIIKGKFSQKQVESIFRKYINMYVLCDSCNKHNTTLIRDSITRIYFLKCDVCLSQRSVEVISSKT